ncbi:hypothetical protein F4678DRAFT_417331 [Xylaria arbuscula]|nr:hypothetical protein F4678DRAFT_417331 [Xylaria arbuscula]
MWRVGYLLRYIMRTPKNRNRSDLSFTYTLCLFVSMPITSTTSLNLHDDLHINIDAQRRPVRLCKLLSQPEPSYSYLIFIARQGFSIGYILLRGALSQERKTASSCGTVPIR